MQTRSMKMRFDDVLAGCVGRSSTVVDLARFGVSGWLAGRS